MFNINRMMFDDTLDDVCSLMTGQVTKTIKNNQGRGLISFVVVPVALFLLLCYYIGVAVLALVGGLILPVFGWLFLYMILMFVLTIILDIILMPVWLVVRPLIKVARYVYNWFDVSIN